MISAMDTKMFQQKYDEALQLIQQRRLDDAEKILRDLLRHTPDQPQLLKRIADICFHTGRNVEAVRLLHQAISFAPNDVDVLNFLAFVLLKSGRPEESLQIQMQAEKIDPRNFRTQQNIGNIYAALGQHDEAMRHFAFSRELNPQMPEVYFAAAGSLFALNQLDAAKGAYEQTLRLRSDYLPAYTGLGKCLSAMNDLKGAQQVYEEALLIDAGFEPAQLGLGEVFLASARPQEALQCYESLICINPKNHEALHGRGEALRQLGRLDDARLDFIKAADIAPLAVHHHYALANLGRFSPGDARLGTLEALAKQIARLPPAEVINLHFSLGKAYDDLGRYSDAFYHWQLGNKKMRQMVGYDESSMIGMLDALQNAFPSDILKRGGAGNASDRQIFVVGMPRSGTTLMEQMLASHPQFFGAGEKMEIFRLLGENMLGDNFPYSVSDLDAEKWQQFGEAYEARMNALAPSSARHIINKLPANFMMVGLIFLALPGAKIIHMQRDPLDTCFSCYTNMFSQNIDYSYDLAELGRYYRAYDNMMAHWRRNLPPDVMLDVSYESLVANFESEAKRIVAFCGAEWDPACLSFYKTKRTVNTLSAAQVRQPVYGSAVGRAAPYREWLQPLCDALDRP